MGVSYTTTSVWRIKIIFSRINNFQRSKKRYCSSKCSVCKVNYARSCGRTNGWVLLSALEMVANSSCDTFCDFPAKEPKRRKFHYQIKNPQNKSTGLKIRVALLCKYTTPLLQMLRSMLSGAEKSPLP